MRTENRGRLRRGFAGVIVGVIAGFVAISRGAVRVCVFFFLLSGNRFMLSMLRRLMLRRPIIPLSDQHNPRYYRKVGTVRCSTS